MKGEEKTAETQMVVVSTSPPKSTPSFVTSPKCSRWHICPWFFSYFSSFGFSPSFSLSLLFFFPPFQFPVLSVLLILSESASLMYSDQVQGYAFVLEGAREMGVTGAGYLWQLQCQDSFCTFNSLSPSSP